MNVLLGSLYNPLSMTMNDVNNYVNLVVQV